MNAIQFIKLYGLHSARVTVDDAQENTHYCTETGYHSIELDVNYEPCPDCVYLSDLKRLVESMDFVEHFGNDLVGAKQLLEFSKDCKTIELCMGSLHVMSNIKSEFEKWYRDKYQITKPLYFFEDTHRYEDGFTQDAWEVWQHQQTKVDELQKQRDSFIKAYEIEMDERVELQKRVDAVKTLIEEYRDPPTEDKTFCHALSIVAYELEQALKGGSDE